MLDSPTLPIEVIDKIFQALKRCDDVPSLKSCSLVSNIFLPLSRRYLFQKTVLYITVASADSTPRVHTNCLKFLSDDNHVASFIRNLSIVPHPPHLNPFDTSGAFQNIDQHTLSIDAATSMLNALRSKAMSLSILSIHSNMLSDWTSFDTRLRSAVLAFCNAPTLQCLEVRYLGVSMRELEHLVGHNSSIKALLLHGVYQARPGAIDSLPAPQSVETSQQTSSTPLRLDICLENPGSAYLMIPFIHRVGRRLCSLKWRSSPCLVDQDTYFHLLDLHHLPNLKEITLGLPLRSNTGLDDLSAFLSGNSDVENVSMDTSDSKSFEMPLQHITLEFDCQNLPTVQVYSSWNWPTLDRVLSPRQSVGNGQISNYTHNGAEGYSNTLSRNAYPQLRSVALTVKRTPMSPVRPALLDQLFEIFQQNLPRATSYGLLKKQTDVIEHIV